VRCGTGRWRRTEQRGRQGWSRSCS